MLSVMPSVPRVSMQANACSLCMSCSLQFEPDRGSQHLVLAWNLQHSPSKVQIALNAECSHECAMSVKSQQQQRA